MPELSPAEAIRRARAALDLPDTAEGTAHRVERLDRPGAAYFLVHVDDRIAAVDAGTGIMMVSARSPQSPLMVSAPEALRIAEVDAHAHPSLAWMPCTLSLSMLDPFWAVRGERVCVYVDQRGRVWPDLAPKRPGGG